MDQGIISKCRVALAAVGPIPIYAKEASNIIIGKEPSEQNIKLVAQKAQEIASPISDMRGTIDHRKDLIEVLTRRTMNKAIERIGA